MKIGPPPAPHHSAQPLHLKYVLDGYTFRDDVRPCPKDRLSDAKRILKRKSDGWAA